MRIDLLILILHHEKLGTFLSSPILLTIESPVFYFFVVTLQVDFLNE